MSDGPRACWCVINHPQTAAERAEVVASLNFARRIGDHSAIWLCTAMLTGPCPAWTPEDDDTTPQERHVNEITRALLEGATPDEALTRETMRLFIARQITCPVKGSILDLKTVVMIEIGGGRQVLSGAAWDEVGGEVLARCADQGHLPLVHDARLMRWSDRTPAWEDYGVYREALGAYDDEEFARWLTIRFPWGGADLAHQRQVFESLRQFAEGDAVRVMRPTDDMPRGTRGRTVGRPYEVGGRAIQFVELEDRRRVAVSLGWLRPAPLAPAPDPSANGEADAENAATEPRAAELERGDWIVLWAGPTGSAEAEVTRVTPDGDGHVLIELDELEWAVLRVKADQPVTLAS
ncbi:hypothetical protein [Actinomadura litoris]|uniref:hypothetical protein n=1 Tax=Actinomadura litoris TaxID=2678616 RepID=UPI001FA71230|nr:hypothetical protein [Actinomadura litoris]